MSRLDEGSVEARLERLERMVEELHRRLPAPAAAQAAPPPRPRLPSELPGLLRMDGQTWLNRLGIALLLLGVALLFRYSIDMGWLTPLVRTAFGVAVGTVLTLLGARMDPGRRFAAVLLGGGIATFYISGWAAFHLYGLLPYALAFAGMAAITASAFGLALWRGQPALAILGAAGGLGTPLLLGISFATPRGIALYASAVLAWTVVPYLRRGWRLVLWASIAFGWALLASYANLIAFEGAPAASRAWLQGAAVFAWLLLGVLPLVRRAAAAAAAARVGVRERRWRETELLHWYGVALLCPALAVLTTALLWRLDGDGWGLLLAGAAGLHALGAAAVRGRDPRLSRVLLFAAAVLLPAGSVGALSGEVLLLALAAQAVALHALARSGAGPAVRWMAHKLAAGTGLWLLVRLVDGGDRWGDLAAAGAMLAASYLVARHREAVGYRVFAQVALLGWLWRELAPLSGGQGFATIAWGACGLVLLVAAMQRGWPAAERVALATLLATVAKLFLVDLARLEPLFRVLLFLGFGTVFLWLSYALSAGWRARRSAG
jgi:hypothetical protein